MRIGHERQRAPKEGILGLVIAYVNDAESANSPVKVASIRPREAGSSTSKAPSRTIHRGFWRTTRAKARHCFSSSVRRRSHRSTLSKTGWRRSRPTSTKGFGDDGVAIKGDWMRVGDGATHCARRDVGSRRHERHGLARWVRDPAAARAKVRRSP
jgi:hypothetical protein